MSKSQLEQYSEKIAELNKRKTDEEKNLVLRFINKQPTIIHDRKSASRSNQPANAGAKKCATKPVMEEFQKC